MESLTTREGYFDRKDVYMAGDCKLHFRRVLPRKAKNWMALDLAEQALVFDEDTGLVYEGYTFELMLTMNMLRYYTDLDMSVYPDEESWYQLYDALESHSAIAFLSEELKEDLDHVLGIYAKLYEAAGRTFQQRRSLTYLAKRSFGSLLTTEDFAETIAKTKGMNGKMIDLLDAFQKIQTPKSMTASGLIPFAKRPSHGMSRN